MPRNPPDSWGQLGRMRENEGVNSIKTTGRSLYCRRICNRERGRTVWNGLERPCIRKLSVRYYLANEIYY